MRMTQGVHRAAQIKPDAIATIFGERKRSWGAFQDRVARLAAVLVSQGLQPGDRVAAIMQNSDRYIELYYAVWWAGGVIVPGNTRWAVAEHAYALQDSGAELLVADRVFAGLAASLTQAAPVRSVLFLDDGDAPVGTIEVEALIGSTSPMADACSQDNALAALFYTGGTTGRSKGVMLTHQSLITSYLCGAALNPSSENQIFLHSAPMFHIGDAGRIIGTTIMGGTHVTVPFFSPENVCRVIESEKVTDLLLVPTMLSMLREYADAHPVDLSSVGLVAYGAAPITETQLLQAMEMFPNAAFFQGYGMTEMSPSVTFLTPEFHKTSPAGKSYLRSIGRAIVGVDVKVVDEQMVEKPRGAVGEIAVRGPGLMAGYWKQPELTRKAVIDGWLLTGDAGYMDEEGFVFLVDRMKDMIVSGAENIYSAEIENALSSHADIVECAVIGIPDEKWGETVHAVVRLTAGAVTSAEEIIAHCQAQIARYKCPRSVEFRTEPLPLSGAGKILKTELRKPYWGDGNPPGNPA